MFDKKWPIIKPKSTIAVLLSVVISCRLCAFVSKNENLSYKMKSELSDESKGKVSLDTAHKKSPFFI